MYTSDTFIEASIKRNNGIKGVVYIILLIIIALLILAAIYAVPIVIGFYELLYASIPLTALVIWGLVILIQRRYVEYEIEIVNDLFTVTKIVGKKKRVDLAEFSVKDCDYIYVPAAPTVAPLASASTDKLSDEYLIADNHLSLGNFAGLPSITIPLGLENGLPFGANLMGRAFEEKALFQAAEAVEQITGLNNLSVLNKKEGNL